MSGVGKSLLRKVGLRSVTVLNSSGRSMWRGSSNPIGIYEPPMAVTRFHSSSQFFPRVNTQAWVSLTLHFLKIVLEQHGIELEMEHVMMMYKIFLEHREELGMCFAGVGFIYDLLKSKEAKSAERKEKVQKMIRSPRYLEVLRAEMSAKDKKDSERMRVEAEQLYELKESGAATEKVGKILTNEPKKVGAVEKVGKIVTITEEMNLDDVDKTVEKFSSLLKSGNIKKITMEVEDKKLKWTVEEKLT